MNQASLSFLDKRTYDDRLYDLDCTDLLDDDEVIVSAVVQCDVPAGNGLVFGDAMSNPAPIYYPRTGRTAQIGKALQVRISGGVLPGGEGFLLCTVRALMATNINPQLEATVSLRLIDSPP